MFEFLNYSFIQNALYYVLILGFSTSVLGIFVVIKRYALISDTLSHIALLGTSIGVLVGHFELYIALGLVVAMALLIEYLRHFSKVYSDCILAIFLSISLALSVLIISISDKGNNMMNYLFGNLFAISGNDLTLIMIFSPIFLLFICLFHKHFLILSFDELLAKSFGLKVFSLNAAFMIFTALLVILGIRAVGVLLMSALMIIPAISALNLEQNFYITVIMSAGFSAMAVLAGVIASFHLDLPSSAMIVLVAFMIFLLTLAIKKLKGI